MKKRYQQPAINVMDIETECICAATINFESDGGSGSGRLDPEKSASGDALSKEFGGSLWDE